MPLTAGGDISIDALGFFNPYGYEDNSGNPIFWHPQNDPGVGFDIKNHTHFKPSVGPSSEPGYGFKWYAKGSAGKCGYNIRRGGTTVTEAMIFNDLNEFVSGGGISCDGMDCINIVVVNDSNNPLGNYSFDFNGSNQQTDSNGDHTDSMLADPATQSDIYGCNSWKITLKVTEFNTTLSQNCKLGCTDGTGLNNPIGSSAACNYDPTAGVDDGSCIYADCSDMCPDPSITSYTSYSGLGIYPSNPSSVFPFAWQSGGGDAYFSAQCPNCCVGGNTGVLPSDCVDCLGVCGGTATYDECGVCDGPGPDQCGVCFGDGTCCVGCMDPTAINFDEKALINCEDCCEYIEIECKLRELSRMVIDSCPDNCDNEAKDLLLECGNCKNC